MCQALKYKEKISKFSEFYLVEMVKVQTGTQHKYTTPSMLRINGFMTAQNAIEYTRENRKLQSRATKLQQKHRIQVNVCASFVPLHLIFLSELFRSHPIPHHLGFCFALLYLCKVHLFMRNIRSLCTLHRYWLKSCKQVVDFHAFHLSKHFMLKISVLTKDITANAHGMMHFFHINIFDMTHLFRLQSFEMDETGSGHSSFCSLYLSHSRCSIAVLFCFSCFVVVLFCI